MSLQLKLLLDDSTVIHAMQSVARADISAVSKTAITDALALPRQAFASLVPRSAGRGPHLADSLGIYVRAFRKGHGAYGLLGEKVVGGRTVVKHFHATEAGTVPRVRKRIGGKYSYVETIIAQMSDTRKNYYRRTEAIEGKHYLERAFKSQIPNMVQIIKLNWQNGILKKWTDRAL